MNQSVIPQLESWRKQLQIHKKRMKDDPQFLPIKQLAFEISRGLERDGTGGDELTQICSKLCDRALIHRAQMMRERLGTASEDDVLAQFRQLVEASTSNNGKPVDFASFAKQWEQPLHGAVFTAHPTFMMSRKMRAVLVELIDQDGELDEQQAALRLADLSHAPDEDISLAIEHEQVQEALKNAREANRRMSLTILEVARKHYPKNWMSLDPKPVELNSWVGYDMDGRNDIAWYDSIRFRLTEKHLQISHALLMSSRVREALGAGKASRELQKLEELFAAELVLLDRNIELFAGDLEDPKILSIAANHLTRNSDKGLGGDLTKALALLSKALEHAQSDDAQLQLVLLRARIKAQGLGTARMHFRVNASQLHNVARVPLNIVGNVDLGSRVMLTKLDELIMETKPQNINFASLALERATAIRQFFSDDANPQTY